VAAHRVRGRFTSGHRIDRLRKDNLEAVRSRPQFLDLKGRFARPHKTLQTVGGGTKTAPSPIAEPHEDAAVRALLHPNHGRRKALAKWKASSLILAFNLLEVE